MIYGAYSGKKFVNNSFFIRLRMNDLAPHGLYDLERIKAVGETSAPPLNLSRAKAFFMISGFLWCIWIIECPKHEKTIGNMQIIYRDGSRPCSAYGKMIPIIPRPSFAQTLEKISYEASRSHDTLKNLMNEKSQ